MRGSILILCYLPWISRVKYLGIPLRTGKVPHKVPAVVCRLNQWAERRTYNEEDILEHGAGSVVGVLREEYISYFIHFMFYLSMGG